MKPDCLCTIAWPDVSKGGRRDPGWRLNPACPIHSFVTIKKALSAARDR
jgi:hypothetical protein